MEEFGERLKAVISKLEEIRATDEVLFDEWMPHYVEWPLDIEVSCEGGKWRPDIPGLYEGDIFSSKIAAEWDVAAFLDDFYGLMKQAMEGTLSRKTIIPYEQEEEATDDDHDY